MLQSKGPLAEWLGKALQKLLQRFESARDLFHRPGYFRGDVFKRMFSKIIFYVGISACIALIACCFLPWVHYNNINETFTGFNVKKFVTGNYYGRAGIIITVISSFVLIFMLVPKLWAKRVNLFVAALLFAYCIRTYIIFTSALFEGEVEKYVAIYLIMILSFVVLVAAVFPRMKGG